MTTARKNYQYLYCCRFWANKKHVAYQTAQKLYHQQKTQCGSHGMFNYPLLGTFLLAAIEPDPNDVYLFDSIVLYYKNNL
jgi:hypothetical protein